MLVAQIQTLAQKMTELKGAKRPNLKRVKKTTDDMLGTDAKFMSSKADFKANLKTVKKEEEKVKLLALTIIHRMRGKKVVYNLLYIYFTEGRGD